MKIKPTKVARPYTLSEVAKHFEYPKRRLELQPISLSERGEIYSHDIKKIKRKDYRLSTLAASLLVIENNEDSATLYKHVDLFEKERTNRPKRYAHVSLLFLCKKLLNEKEVRRIKAERKRMEEGHRFLDDLINFTDPCSASNN